MILLNNHGTDTNILVLLILGHPYVIQIYDNIKSRK